MEHYASEQEQVEQLKKWWKENGRSLVFGLVLGVGGLAGYRYWDANQTARAENASITYEQFLDLAGNDRRSEAVELGRAIVENYPDTAYARLSALMLARLAVESGEYDEAKALLESLIAQPSDAGLEHVARGRLARLYLAEGDTGRAAELLDAVPPAGDEQRFAELRADVLAARGDIDGARTLYLEALARARSLGLEQGAIQLKLDNLASSGTAGDS